MDILKPKPRNFMALLRAQWVLEKFVCVGLDTEWEKIPPARRYPQKDDAITNFNENIIDRTGDVAAAWKLNLAFYLAYGEAGISALRRTILYAHKRFPEVPVILDAKFGDIGNASIGYRAFVKEIGADAITVNPYVGQIALKPFLDDPDLGVIVLCRTLNEGGGEFQSHRIVGSGRPLYHHVACNVTDDWNKNSNNCMLVIGATCPDELRAVRQIVPDIPLLIPGVGAQGGKVENIVPYAMDSNGVGFIINSSRAIIFNPDPRQATIDLNNSINHLRNLNRKT